jgi:hypothetical protein
MRTLRLPFLALGAALALAMSPAWALTYSWTPSTAPYAPIAGTPVTFTSPDNAMTAVSLPFAFTYDSLAYTSVQVSSNGYLQFGVAYNSYYNPDLFSTFSPYSVLAPWWDDLIDDATGTVAWIVSGTAPNRVFTLQYSAYPDYASTPNARLEFQAKLFETSNRIQFCYGGKTGTANASGTASLGIKGRLGGTFIDGGTGSRTLGISTLNAETQFPAANTVFGFAPDTAAPLNLKALPGNAKMDLDWKRTRLSTFLRYRIYVGTSPTTLVLRDSTLSATDTVRAISGLTNGATTYFAVSTVGTDFSESGFAQVISAVPTQPPGVSITAPANGAVVHSTSSVSFTATASDPDGSVTRVEYYYGATLAATASSGSGPTWPATWFSPIAGTFVITAKAYDNLGAVTVSSPITIRVNPTPSVSMTGPVYGSFHLPGADIAISAIASDPGGAIAKVEFYQGSVKLGEDASSPYAFTWTSVPTGVYSITARAIDNDGGIGFSDVINVTVSTPPTVKFTAPADGAVLAFPGTVPLSANASDADGTISRVDFYNGFSFIGSDYTGSPFTLTWSPLASGSQMLIAIAFDNLATPSKPDTINVVLSTGPQVSLTAPVHNGAYATGGTVAIAANAIATVSPITEVAFYSDSVLLATDATAPYAFTWSGVPRGRYRIQARARDGNGIIGYSQSVSIFVNDSAKAVSGGRVLVTGHDAEDHSNVDFISAGLDYLLFGRAARAFEIPFRKGARIGFLGTKAFGLKILDYQAATFINVSLAGWDALAFDGVHYDALIVGTGLDFLSTAGSAALNAKRTRFDAYFNQGGALFAMSEQGVGQTYYNFLPAFGTAKQQSIGDISGRFSVTPAGAAIGLTEAIVDRDLTHTEFLDVDTLFRVFETFNDDGRPITIGANAIIEDGVFVPADSVVEPPVALARDSIFADTLCVRFTSGTTGAAIYITTDGGNPDTSSRVVANGGMLCIDRSTTFRAIAKKTGWINSPDKSFFFRKSGQVVTPVPSVLLPWFRDSLCVHFTSPTAGAVLHYTLNGGNPDTSSLTKPNGDSVCFYASDTIRIVGKRVDLNSSDTVSFPYLKMEKVAAPGLDAADPTLFADSICVTFSEATPGAHIRYTLDGGPLDTAETHVHNGDRICLDRSVIIRAMAEKTNWIPSDEISVRLIKMNRVAPPIANLPDSTRFADTVCVRFATATDSATIHYTLDGGVPDTLAKVLAKDSSLCVDRTILVKAVATRPGWVSSREARVNLLKMDTAAVPTALPGDSAYFAGALCVALTSSTPGAEIHYALKGADPAVSGLVKANGDTVCVEDTALIRAYAVKRDFVKSPVVAFHYIRMQKVALPVADKRDSTWFADSLCIRFTVATPEARLHYTLDGGDPDTSSAMLDSGGRLCRDRTADIRVSATRPNWIPSDPLRLRALKMDTVARPISDRPDSTWYADSLCVNITSPTPGADIHYTLDGGSPDTARARLAGSGRLCFDDTVTVRARGTKPDWVAGPEASWTYIRMQKAATPLADKADSLYFPDTLCVRFISGTEGTRIRYTLDGGRADTSSRSIANGDSLCLDASATIAAAAAKTHWITSDETRVHFNRMETVAAPETDAPDSTYFKDSLCVRWDIATPGAAIHLSRDGAVPDSATPGRPRGYSTCMDSSTVWKAMGTRKNWKDSPIITRRYFRMRPAEKPRFDHGDTVFYPSICVRLLSGTEGADLHYTTDGGDPDTSSRIKQGGDTICVDRSSDIRVIAKKRNWLDSEPAGIHVEKMRQISPIVSSVGDSVIYARKLCFTLSSATDSIRIAYSLDGGDPRASGLTMASGDTLCLERSAEIKAVGIRPRWRDSETARFVFEVDNDGPDIAKAEKRPYQTRDLSVSGNCRGIGQDTLVLTLTEKLAAASTPPRWDRLARFSPRCDTASTLRVPVQGVPTLSRDSLTITIVLDNASKEEPPMLGNCVYLDRASGEFADRVGNRPSAKGARVEGREKVVHISQLRAYPPVVGLESAKTSPGCLDEGIVDNTWIPPYGFDERKGAIDEGMVASCTNRSEDEGQAKRSRIPGCLSILEVVSDGAYRADIAIFDHLGNYVNGSRQQFGACGELDNINRTAAGKKRSYLVWNVRDTQGARVGNGVYIWRVNFLSESEGRKSLQKVFVKTGFLRGASCGE